MAEFGKQASKAVGDYAGFKERSLTQQANDEPDPDKRQALLDEAQQWKEGGSHRVALHAVVGGLTGDLGGAVGGSAGAAAGFNQDTNNRQLHPSEKQRIQELARKKAQDTCRGDASCLQHATLYWSDMLERVAEGQVDTQEAIKNQAMYEQIIAAAGHKGSQASMGMAESFFEHLGEARRMLAADAGKPIVDGRGRVVLGTDGQAQTYFSATQAQRDNPYGNIFPGGSPSSQASVMPGKERREQSLLEGMNARSGQATPDTTLEELLFGVRLPVKGGTQASQGVARAWESGKVLDAGDILISQGGNISAQQITRVGTPAGLVPDELSLLKQMDSMTSSQAGVVREVVADSYFQRNGFTAMDGKCGAGNCFDGVYVKGDRVIVNEVKPLNADGSIKLSSATGGLPTQGTIQWVESRANQLLKSGDPGKIETGKMILQASRSGSLTTVVSGVNGNGMVIVKVKP